MPSIQQLQNEITSLKARLVIADKKIVKLEAAAKKKRKAPVKSSQGKGKSQDDLLK